MFNRVHIYNIPITNRLYSVRLPRCHPSCSRAHPTGAYVSASKSVLGHPGLGRRTHTKPSAAVLIPMFCLPQSSFRHGCFLLLAFTRDVYRLTLRLFSPKYKVNLNPAFPPPMTYINNESQTNHSERMCVTMQSSRTFATNQTSG